MGNDRDSCSASRSLFAASVASSIMRKSLIFIMTIPENHIGRNEWVIATLWAPMLAKANAQRDFLGEHRFSPL